MYQSPLLFSIIFQAYICQNMGPSTKGLQISKRHHLLYKIKAKKTLQILLVADIINNIFVVKSFVKFLFAIFLLLF